MDEAFEVEPWLAERWTYDQAQNTCLFFLKSGVTFHSGQALTAEDVKFTFDLIAAADPSNYQQIGPDSVRVVDSRTVAITPMRPNGRLAEQIEFGTLILTVSSLSFLGLGAQPPTPEWSAMFNDAKSVFLVAHALLAPGAAVTLAVLDANLLGELLWPRNRRRPWHRSAGAEPWPPSGRAPGSRP